MGIEIAEGMDTRIDDANNITGNATGWASRQNAVSESLKSANNLFGTAAKANAVSTNTEGGVPLLDANGKIPINQVPTATIGGSASAGLVPALDTQGQIPTSMISSVTTGSGGVKGIWVFGKEDMGGNTGTWNSVDRQWSHTWVPEDQNGNYLNVTSILIVATGGGGSGAHGPPAIRSGGLPGGGNVNGYDARKGGGGAAGSTVIALRKGITSATSYTIKIGSGGDAMTTTSAKSLSDGASTQVDGGITAGGGGYGNPLGNGGSSVAGGVGDAYNGIYIFGGSGDDGIFDRMGGGKGGSSWWGGGFSPAGGRVGDGVAGARFVAPGGGGGAAHGSAGIPPYTFTANADGFAGSHGICMIIGY